MRSTQCIGDGDLSSRSKPEGDASGTSSPITVSGLANGTLYSCTVLAHNFLGDGPPSSPATVTPPGATAPSPVTSISCAAGPGPKQVTVSFTPGSDGGSPILYFHAFSASTADFNNGTSSPIIVTVAVPGDYQFSVYAVNAIGQSSEAAACLPGVTIP